MNTSTKPIEALELEISRHFEASRELIFTAWTDPKHFLKWAGPRGFTGTIDTFDCKPGGMYRTCLHAPDGTEHWARGRYLEVSSPHRLVFTHQWEGERGEPGPETTVTVSLSERDGGTLMHFHQSGFESADNRDGHERGWVESFDRLRAHIAELAK